MRGDVAERSQRLLRTAVLLRVSKALVLLDLSESLLFFDAKLDVIEGFIGKTDQVGRDSDTELAEANLSIGLVTKTTQNRIDVLLQNFLLELEQEVFYVLEIQESKVTLVNHTED